MNLVMEMGLTGTTVPAVTPLMTFCSLATSQPLALCCPRSEGHDMSPRKPAPRAGAGRGGACGPAGFAPTPFSTALPVGELPAGRAAESRELR